MASARSFCDALPCLPSRTALPASDVNPAAAAAALPRPQVALRYYAAFIATLRREWFMIDHLRLDKFLMLIRRFFRAGLRRLQGAGW